MNVEKVLLVEALINKELENIETILQELKGYGIFPKITTDSIKGFQLNDTASCRIIGPAIHDYYSSVEKIFKFIAKTIDKAIPDTANWHKELLDQMTLNINGLRPCLISEKTAERLDEYRGFRQIFRNIYGFHLSFRRLEDLLLQLQETSERLKKDLYLFIKNMRTIFQLPE